MNIHNIDNFLEFLNNNTTKQLAVEPILRFHNKKLFNIIRFLNYIDGININCKVYNKVNTLFMEYTNYFKIDVYNIYLDFINIDATLLEKLHIINKKYFLVVKVLVLKIFNQ